MWGSGVVLRFTHYVSASDGICGMEDREACHARPHPHVASLRGPSPDIGRGAADGRGEGRHAEP